MKWSVSARSHSASAGEAAKLLRADATASAAPRLKRNRIFWFVTGRLPKAEAQGVENVGVLWKPSGGQTAPDGLVGHGGVQGAAACALRQMTPQGFGQGATARVETFRRAAGLRPREPGGADALGPLGAPPGQTA